MARHLLVIALRLGVSPPRLAVTIPIESEPDMTAVVFGHHLVPLNTALPDMLSSARAYVRDCIAQHYRRDIRDILDYRYVFIVPPQYNGLSPNQLQQAVRSAGFVSRRGFNDTSLLIPEDMATMSYFAGSLRQRGFNVQVNNDGEFVISDSEGQLDTATLTNQTTSTIRFSGTTELTLLHGALYRVALQYQPLPLPRAPRHP